MCKFMYAYNLVEAIQRYLNHNVISGKKLTAQVNKTGFQNKPKVVGLEEFGYIKIYKHINVIIQHLLHSSITVGKRQSITLKKLKR